MGRKRPPADSSMPFATTVPAESMAATATEHLPELPGYRCLKLLGQGGMGSVYLAKQQATGRSVAVKLMRATAGASEANRARFLREIRVMAALRHPRLVEILEAGETAGDVYFAMELCEGGSTGERARRAGGHLGVDATASGASTGTLPFMPREQIVNFKRVRPSTDVWAMAATLYWLLTGETPREVHKGDKTIAAILNRTVIPIRERAPDVPERLADVIDHALRDAASERPQHAGALRALLLEAVAC